MTLDLMSTGSAFYDSFLYYVSERLHNKNSKLNDDMLG